MPATGGGEVGILNECLLLFEQHDQQVHFCQRLAGKMHRGYGKAQTP